MRLTMLCVLTALVGCDGGDAKSPDGDDTDTLVVADTTADVAWLADGAPPVAAPAIPWLETGAPVELPVFTCREGWTPTTLTNGATICEPWGVGGREDCASATAMHLPGEAGCEEVGAACPVGDWPVGLPSVGVVYVAPGGSGDGTSAASPLGDLASAVAAVGAGGTIALAKGSYVGGVTIDKTVTVRGACAAETILTGAALGQDDGVVEVDGAEVTLSDLQISGASGMGVRGDGGDVTLDGVVLRGNTHYNVYQVGGSLTMRGSLVADARERPSDGAFGYGLTTIDASFDVRDSAMLGNTGLGMKLEQGAGVVEGCVVAGTLPRASDDDLGYGIASQRDVSVDLAGVVIEGGYAAGFTCVHEASCTLEDVVIRDVQSSAATGLAGDGLFVSGTASATGTRVYIDNTGFSGARGLAIDLPPEAVLLDLTDLVVTGTNPAAADDLGGYGIVGVGAQTVRLTRAVFSDTAAGGAFLTEGANGVFTDLVVARSRRVGGLGFGVDVDTEIASVSVERARFLDNEGAAMQVLGFVNLTDVEASNAGVPVGDRASGFLLFGGAEVSVRRVVAQDVSQFGFNIERGGEVLAEDVVVRHVGVGGPADHGLEGFGLGVNVAGNTNATVSRVATSDTVALGFSGIGPMTVDDLRVTGVVSEPAGGTLGLGAFFEPGAEVIGHRWIIEDTHSAGIGLTGATLDLTDALVGAVSPRPCAADDCADDPSAVGVYSDRSSRLDLTNFLLSGAATGGAWTEGLLYLTNGVIEDTPFGFGSGGRNVVRWEAVDTSGAGEQSPSAEIKAPSMAY
jgi:hypothetical protein